MYHLSKQLDPESHPFPHHPTSPIPNITRNGWYPKMVGSLLGLPPYPYYMSGGFIPI
jgi:hypothetical protein